MHNPDNTVEWQLFYTSSNDKALDFIKNFEEDMIKFTSDDIEFTPRFVTWACPNCDPEFKKKECVSNGQYCAMNHASTYMKGREIIEEDLREYCLFKNMKAKGTLEKWWSYMSHIHKLCYDEIAERCSMLAHQFIKEDFATTQ